MVSGRDRRTPGLRRGELAALADVSTDYVVRMEQGRARPSPSVLAALARALRLTGDERDHLFRLAGHEAPGDGRVSSVAPAGVQRVLARLGDVAIAVFSADWTLVAWSPLWGALMGVSPSQPPRETNLLRVAFAQGDGPGGFGAHPIRTLGDPRQDRADLVADLRAATGRHPRDPGLASLVEDLLGNEEFAATWRRGEVARHDAVQKLVAHPLGDIVLDCDTLFVPGADLNVLIYTAAEGTPAAELLELLAPQSTNRSVDKPRRAPYRPACQPTS